MSMRSRCFLHPAVGLAGSLKITFIFLTHEQKFYYEVQEEGFHNLLGSLVTNSGFYILAALKGKGADWCLGAKGYKAPRLGVR